MKRIALSLCVLVVAALFVVAGEDTFLRTNNGDGAYTFTRTANVFQRASDTPATNPLHSWTVSGCTNDPLLNGVYLFNGVWTDPDRYTNTSGCILGFVDGDNGSWRLVDSTGTVRSVWVGYPHSNPLDVGTETPTVSPNFALEATGTWAAVMYPAALHPGGTMLGWTNRLSAVATNQYRIAGVSALTGGGDLWSSSGPHVFTGTYENEGGGTFVGVQFHALD